MGSMMPILSTLTPAYTHARHHHHTPHHTGDLLSLKGAMDLAMVLGFRPVSAFFAKRPPPDLIMMQMGAAAVAVFFLAVAFVGQVVLSTQSQHLNGNTHTSIGAPLQPY